MFKRKKPKDYSMYRTTWHSIKNQVDAAALKLCKFKKALGPDLDKVSKTMEGLYDEEEISEKKVNALTASVQDIQSTIRAYVTQVLELNEAHPEHGPSWRNLHKALKDVDDLLVDEAKEFGAKVRQLDVWAGKEVFEKRGVEGRTNEDADHASEVETLVKKLLPLRTDPIAVMKVVGGKAIGGCFPHSQSLGESIQKKAGPVPGALNYMETKLKAETPDLENARQALAQVRILLDDVYQLLGKDAKLLRDFLERFVYQVYEAKVQG